MYVEVVRICKQLHVLLSVSLMFIEVKSRSPYNRPIILFNFSFGFGNVCCRCDVSFVEYEHMYVKTFLTKGCLLSDKMVSRIPYKITHLLKKILSTWIDVILVVSTARVGILYRISMITTNRFPDLVCWSDPRMSIATIPRRRPGGKSSGKRWYRNFVLIMGQFTKHRAVLQSLTAMFGL